MEKILFYGILVPISKLPLPVLYAIGRFFYFVGFRLFGYRKKVVYGNFRAAFPEWTEEEVDAHARKFYRFFFDSMAESIKLFSMSTEETIVRSRVENPEMVAHHAANGQSIIVVGAHYANWEIAALSFHPQFKGQTVTGIYSPLKNPTMDKLIMDNRRRTGTNLVSRREVTDYISEDPKRPAVDFFIADQSPSNAAWWKIHWTHFLNQTTSFLAGPERYAVRYNRPVYYLTLRYVKRGHYTARIYPITETPRDTEPGFITESCARILEKEIHRAPTYWLWTHRRWKRGVAPEAAKALEGKDFVAAEYDRDLTV